MLIAGNRGSTPRCEGSSTTRFGMSDSPRLVVHSLTRHPDGAEAYELVLSFADEDGEAGAAWHAAIVHEPGGWRMVPHEDLALALDLLAIDDTPPTRRPSNRVGS